MKSLISISFFAVLLGLGLGAVMAYVEVPGVFKPLPVPPTQAREQASGAEEKTVASEITGPQAEVPELVYEFGNMERGSTLSHVFKIRNIGTSPLYVEVASTTCKCTVGDLSKNNIGPNEEAEILLEWVAKTGPGPFRHGAVLSTNDPAQSSIHLTVEGQIVESTAMSPPSLIFGSVRAGESPSASLFLMSFLEEDVEVSDYELSDEELSKQMEVRISPVDRSELPSSDAVSGVKVTVTFKAGKTIGPFRNWLTLHTNLQETQKFLVPIAGVVSGDISIFGPGWNSKKGLLRMGSFKSAEGKTVLLKVAIRGEKAQAARFEVVEIDPPQLKATLGEPQQLGKLVHVPLTLEVPVGTPPIARLGEPASSDAHIVLRSNNEEVPDVRLRVQFAVE